MALVFWAPWAVWAKMTFILGCAICLVFAVALGVRYYKKRTVARFAARAAADLAERGEMVQTMRDSGEIPFGIRAIEAGCEVQGVWNSKTNTALQTPTSSNPPSPAIGALGRFHKKRNSSLSSLSKQGLPKLAHPNTLPTQSGGLSALDLSVRGASVHQPDQPSQVRRKSLSLDITYASPRTNPASMQNSPESLTTGCSGYSIFVPPTPKYLQAARRPCHTVVIGGSYEYETRPKDKGILESGSIEVLEKMQADRQCEAEIGQLIPRLRRTNCNDLQSGPTWANDNSSSIDSVKDLELSWPVSNGLAQYGSVSSNRVEIVRAANLAPSHIIVESHPVPKSALPPSSWTQKTTELVNEKLDEKRTVAAAAPVVVPKHPASDPPLQDVSAPHNGSATSHYNTTARKVNEHFEVLPVGSLEKPSPVKELGSAANPDALKANSNVKAKKLQKRIHSGSQNSSRRASTDGDIASGKENVAA